MAGFGDQCITTMLHPHYSLMSLRTSMYMVDMIGFEPMAYPLKAGYSTSELHIHWHPIGELNF